MSGERRPRALVFDLDGTLIDSRRDLATAVNRMRQELGMEVLSVPQVVGMIGEGARNLVRRALGGTPAEAALDRALEIFYRHYGDVCLRDTRAFPGVEAALAALLPRLPLALLTNKPERFTRTIVSGLGWSGTFRPVIGGDTLPRRKPHPDGLLAIAAELALAPSGLLLVGDSRIDAATADAAGAGLALVEWGYADAVERAELAGRRWLAAADELVALV